MTVVLLCCAGSAGAQEVDTDSESPQATSTEAKAETSPVVSTPDMDDDEPAEISKDERLLTEAKPVCRTVEDKEAKPASIAGADRVFAGHRFLNLGSQRSALIMSSFNFEQSVFSLNIPSFAKVKGETEGEFETIGIETEGLGELLGFSLKLSKFMGFLKNF